MECNFIFGIGASASPFNHNIMYLSSLQAGQPELITLEKALKEAMVPAGTAREVSVIFYFNYCCYLDYC